MALSCRTTRRPVALPPAWTTSRRLECPPSSPSARLPWRSASNVHTEELEVAGPCEAPRGTAPPRRSRAGRARVLPARCPRGECPASRRRRQRGRKATLRPIARGLCQRGWRRRAPRVRRGSPRSELHRARPRRRRRRRGRSRCAREPAMRGYRNEMAAPLLLRHPSSLEHDTGAASRARRRGSSRIERALARARLAGLGRARVARRRARRSCCAVHPEATSTSLEARVGARAAARSTPTRSSSEGSYARRAARGGRGGRAGRRAAGRRRPARRRLAAPARPGHHAEAARAMGFCLFNNVAVAARRALDRCGRRARADPRLGRPPRQRDQRHLPRDRRRAVRDRSTSRRCIPGTGPAGDAGSGPGEGYTVNLPVPAGSGDAAWCSLVEDVVVALGHEYRTGAGADLRLLRRARAPTRSPGAASRAEGYAQMAASMRGPGRRARRAGRRGARGWLRPRGTGRIDGGDARGAGRRASAPSSRWSRCTRTPRRPRGGWRGAGRWWAWWRAS